jgi:hypothetical protein
MMGFLRGSEFMAAKRHFHLDQAGRLQRSERPLAAND